MKSTKTNSVYKLCLCAVLLALSTALSLIKVVQMPLGGAVTLLSMLPVCCIAVIYGTAAAVAPCILYGVIQMFIDGVFGWGLNLTTLIGSVVFDYIIAYGILCLAGLFKEKGNKGIVLGVCLAVFARFVSHFVSGCVFFANFEKFGSPVVYSLVYNGAYMLPELAVTAIGAYLLAKANAYNRIFNLVTKR